MSGFVPGLFWATSFVGGKASDSKVELANGGAESIPKVGSVMTMEFSGGIVLSFVSHISASHSGQSLAWSESKTRSLSRV